MTKKHLATGLLAVLLVTIYAPFSAAQSGRGRQLLIAERLNGQTPSSPTIPEDGRRAPAAVTESRVSISGNTTKSRNAILIYRDNGEEHHPNRADKRAGWILLGFLAFFVGAEIANGGDF
jgi:hypothetical protein